MDAAEGQTEPFLDGSSLCLCGSDGKGTVLFTGRYFEADIRCMALIVSISLAQDRVWSSVFSMQDTKLSVHPNYKRDRNDTTRFSLCACLLNALTMFLVLCWMVPSCYCFITTMDSSTVSRNLTNNFPTVADEDTRVNVSDLICLLSLCAMLFQTAQILFGPWMS